MLLKINDSDNNVKAAARHLAAVDKNGIGAWGFAPQTPTVSKLKGE